MYRETGAARLASGENRWSQFSNNRGRGRSRDQVIKLDYFTSFLVDVFNIGVRKMCIKTIYDLDLGLNLLGQLSSC